MIEEVINRVILVNTLDEEIGTMEKLEAHQKGLLHRAFSVFIFNSKKELLLQKRAIGKYHSEGLWTNTCCSHPSPNESIEEAAVRRLKEEMGYECSVVKTFSFIYDVALDNELIEHELDHVVIGISNSNPVLNLAEASDFDWKTIENIKKEMELFPDNFTSWFKIILNEHYDKLVNALNLAYESL